MLVPPFFVAGLATTVDCLFDHLVGGDGLGRGAEEFFTPRPRMDGLDDFGLLVGLQTVRTIIDQGNGRDRTTVKYLQRIDPARFREEPWRARTRAALPKRITEVLAQARALVQAAKGLK